jgi:hypothetical protein
MPTKKKTDNDSQRSQFVHSQAFKWMEKHRPEVMQKIRELSDLKFPRGAGKARKRTELAAELVDLK